jgi:hypothetical protein
MARPAATGGGFAMADPDTITLDALISRHRIAYKAFSVLCRKHDLAQIDVVDPAERARIEQDYNRLDRAETNAAIAVLAYRPKSLAESSARARYIIEAPTIRESLYTENDFVDTFLQSLVLPDA